MDQLSVHMVERILVRLTLKDLARNLSLNHYWKLRIESLEFEAIRAEVFKGKTGKLFLIDSTHSSFYIDMEKNKKTYEMLEELQGTVIGSCCGLICGTEKVNFYVNFYLLNIKTSEFEWMTRRLSLANLDDLEVRHFAFGLGGNDFKIVKVGQILEKQVLENSDKVDTVMEVFSCRESTWKVVLTVRDSTEYFYGDGVWCNGSVYWLLGNVDRYGHLIRWVSEEDGLTMSVGRLNLANNCWEKLIYPTVIDDHYTNLSVFEGKACLTTVKEENFEIWSLQTDGNWEKLFKIQRDVIMVKYWKEILLPLLKVGQKILLLVNDTELIWYHVKKRSAKPWLLFPSKVLICQVIMDSLISCQRVAA